MSTGVSPLSIGGGDAYLHALSAKKNSDAARNRIEMLVRFTDTSLDNAYTRTIEFTATVPQSADAALAPLMRGGIVDLKV